MPRWAAVVGEEEDERVFFLAHLANLVEDLADGIVHRRHHGRERAAVVILNVVESLQILFGSLQRGVLRVERHIQEPRLLSLLAEPVDRPLAVGVGCVKARLVDHPRLARLARVDEQPGAEERAVGERAVKFVESLAGRPEARLFAEVPLADGARCITELAEAFGHRRFIEP